MKETTSDKRKRKRILKKDLKKSGGDDAGAYMKNIARGHVSFGDWNTEDSQTLQ